MESLLYRAFGRLKLAGFLLLVAVLSAAQQDSRQLCGQVPTIASELTQISGMKLKHPVPCDFISKEKVNEFLKKRVKEESQPGGDSGRRVDAQEIWLRPAGFRPGGEYRGPAHRTGRRLLRLQQEEAVHHRVRQPRNRRNRCWRTNCPTPWQTRTSTWRSSSTPGRKSDDGSTARLAVMEGQATWMMSEFLARKNGQSLQTSPALVADDERRIRFGRGRPVPGL